MQGKISSLRWALSSFSSMQLFYLISFLKDFFQLARMLVGAELQQITYREFLPVVLGKKALGNLANQKTTYDQNVDPSILNEFATVAFR